MPVDRTIETRGVIEFSRQIERYGFLFREQNKHDEGIDAQIETTESGQGTGRLLGVQIKTGPSYFKERNETGFVFRFEERHKHLWTNHSLPVILCLVDLENERIFWQHICNNTVLKTGKHYKTIVPTDNLLDKNSSLEIVRLATPTVAHSEYDILGPFDKSHALAKRFHANVVLNPKTRNWNDIEIATVVRQVTREIRKDPYCRNVQVRSTFGEKSANVVWLFVYMRELDIDSANWKCRSLWIDENLDPSHAPSRLIGEHAGDGIIIDWNNPVSAISDLIESFKQTKSEYIPRITVSIGKLELVIEPIAKYVQDFRATNLDESALREHLKPYLSLISREEEDGFERSAAPNDCKRLSKHYYELLTSLSNIKVALSQNAERNRKALAFLLEQQIQSARTSLALCLYELNQSR